MFNSQTTPFGDHVYSLNLWICKIRLIVWSKSGQHASLDLYIRNFSVGFTASLWDAETV